MGAQFLYTQLWVIMKGFSHGFPAFHCISSHRPHLIEKRWLPSWSKWHVSEMIRNSGSIQELNEEIPSRIQCALKKLSVYMHPTVYLCFRHKDLLPSNVAQSVLKPLSSPSTDKDEQRWTKHFARSPCFLVFQVSIVWFFIDLLSIRHVQGQLGQKRVTSWVCGINSAASAGLAVSWMYSCGML